MEFLLKFLERAQSGFNARSMLKDGIGRVLTKKQYNEETLKPVCFV